jgi:hypothetical protein
MGSFSVFMGAGYLLVFTLLSHRPLHPETNSVGAVPLPYLILVQYHAWLRRKTLTERLRAHTTISKTPVLASSTQAETASGVCPTKLRISAGSSRMKSIYHILRKLHEVSVSVFKNMFNDHLHLQLCTLTSR